MNPEFYLIVMSVVCFGAMTVSFFVNYKKVKDELATAIKQDITSQQMKEAEKTIKYFLAQKNIPSGASIYEIGTALNMIVFQGKLI